MTEHALKLVHDVDPETGELIEDASCAECSGLRREVLNKEQNLRDLEKDLRNWRAKYDRLLLDRDEERMSDPRRPEIMALFDYWRERCKHPNARFDAKRFDLIKSRLRDFSAEELRMAIDGAAVQAYVDPVTGKKHDRLGLVFESAERVEDFANRFVRWQKRQVAA